MIPDSRTHLASAPRGHFCGIGRPPKGAHDLVSQTAIHRRSVYPELLGPATIAEWLAIPEEQRAEQIDARNVRHAMPGLLTGVG